MLSSLSNHISLTVHRVRILSLLCLTLFTLSACASRFCIGSPQILYPTSIVGGNFEISWYCLSYDACDQLIHDLISIRLDYCNSLLYNLPKSNLPIERLQKKRNQTARILTKTPRCEHITEVLVCLHWLYKD